MLKDILTQKLTMTHEVGNDTILRMGATAIGSALLITIFAVGLKKAFKVS